MKTGGSSSSAASQSCHFLREGKASSRAEGVAEEFGDQGLLVIVRDKDHIRLIAGEYFKDSSGAVSSGPYKKNSGHANSLLRV